MGENYQTLLVLFLICLALACLDISFFYPKLTTPFKSSPKSAIISRNAQVRHLYSKPHRQALHRPYVDTVERRLIMLDKSANQNGKWALLIGGPTWALHIGGMKYIAGLYPKT